MDKKALAEALVNILTDEEQSNEPTEEQKAAEAEKKAEAALEKAREEARAEAKAEYEAEAKAEAEAEAKSKSKAKNKSGSDDKNKSQDDDEAKNKSGNDDSKGNEDSKEREKARKLAEKEVNLSLRDNLHKSDLSSDHLESISDFLAYDRLTTESGEADVDAVKKLTDALTSIALRTPPKTKRGVDDLRSNKTGLAKYLSE